MQVYVYIHTCRPAYVYKADMYHTNVFFNMCQEQRLVGKIEVGMRNGGRYFLQNFTRH